jgi:hypothetical protein
MVGGAKPRHAEGRKQEATTARATFLEIMLKLYLVAVARECCGLIMMLMYELRLLTLFC